MTELLVLALHQGVEEIVDGAVLVMENVFLPVVLHVHVHILFRVNVDLLLSFLVLDAQCVEPARLALDSRRGHRFEDRARLVRGQGVGDWARGVEDPAREGPVRVALQEGHDDLVADARDGHGPVMAPGQVLERTNQRLELSSNPSRLSQKNQDRCPLIQDTRTTVSPPSSFPGTS